MSFFKLHVALQWLLMVAGGALVGGGLRTTVWGAVLGGLVGFALHLVAGFIWDGGTLSDGESRETMNS